MLLQVERGVHFGGQSGNSEKGVQHASELVPRSRLEEANRRDRVLLNLLGSLEKVRTPSLRREDLGLTFRNPDIGRYASGAYSLGQITALVDTLAEQGTFDVHVQIEPGVFVDNHPHSVTTLKATPEDTSGDMSHRRWLRDANNVGSANRPPERFVLAPSGGYQEVSGISKDLIMSNMHLLSTEPQLKRFENVIKGDASFRADYKNWPYIAPELDNLGGQKPDEWRNKQETVPAVGIEILDALHTGLIRVDELKPANKQFLASLVPFLATTDFDQPNSGPWEEDMTVKTSVIAVETAAIAKVQALKDKEGFEFLREGYEESKQYFPERYQAATMEETLDIMLVEGLTHIGKTFPFESPIYAKDSRQYRGADAALTYILLHGIPELLEKYETPIASMGGVPQTKEAIEDRLLEEFETTLLDPDTNGVYRYLGDTYLGPNYNLESTQTKIKAMKKILQAEAGDGPIDLDKKARLREEIVPDGAQAAWVHPNAEIAAWAAGEYLRTRKDRYLTIATRFFNRTLTTLTGPDDYTVLVDDEGQSFIKKVKPAQATEAWTTFILEDGRKAVLPSPNTSLGWAAARTREAAVTLQSAVALKEHTENGGDIETWKVPAKPKETVVYDLAA